MNTSDRVDEVSDQVIWHYTTREGFKGIVESRSLWATSILYLNDSEEFHHITSLIWNLIESQRAENDEKEHLLFEFLKGNLSSYPATYGPASTLVVSFSKLCDDLSQWRAYCPKGGYCIGFASSTLRALAAPQGYRFEKCIYEPADKLAMIRPLLKRTLQQFRNSKTEISTDQLRTAVQDPRNAPSLLRSLSGTFFTEVQELGAILKHEAFRGEREWRLISTRTTDGTRLEFRPSASMLIPYLPFRLAEAEKGILVNHIVVGPGPNQNLDTHAVASFLLSREVLHGGITSSRIPYRNW